MKKTPSHTLCSDATGERVVAGIVDAEEYVRKIFEQMHSSRFDFVRISIKSDPLRPDYRIEEVFEGDGIESLVPMDGATGRHRRLSEAKFMDSTYWSNAALGSNRNKMLP